MKIQIQFPFTQDYVRAYVSRSKADCRNRVTLLKEDGTGTITAYSRYLMSVKEGRYLTEDEEVDHINNDPTDDGESNLQILTVQDHRDKTISEVPKESLTKLTCSWCGVVFLRPSRIVNHSKVKNPTCDRDCNRKLMSSRMSYLENKPKITKQQLMLIYNLRRVGKTIKEVEALTSVSRSSIVRWMNSIKTQGLNNTLSKLT
jgi:hypothetical protein